MLKNIETKVIASAAGAGGGGVVSAFLLWLLGVLLWHVPNDAEHAVQAAAAAGLLALILVVLGSLIAGYEAPHTHRPDLAPPAPAPATVTTDVPLPDSAPAPVVVPPAPAATSSDDTIGEEVQGL